MMESTNSPTGKKVIKKRKYSRGGCKECKRRKIKCDEAKPYCYSCTRLHKTCVYQQPFPSSSSPQKFQFEDPKIVIVGGSNSSFELDRNRDRISKGTGRFTDTPKNERQRRIHQHSWNNQSIDSVRQQQELHQNNRPSSLKFYQVNHSNIRTSIPSSKSLSHEVDSINDIDINFNHNDLVTNSLQPQSQPQQHPREESPHECRKYKISDVLSPDIDFLNDYNWGSIAPNDVRNLFDDANLLVHDSLEMFGMDQFKPFTSIDGGDQLLNLSSENNYSHSIQSSEELSSIPEFPMPELSHKSESQPLTNSGYKTNIELIESTFQDLDLAGPHEIYLNKLTETELGYHLFPFAHGIGSNAVLKILLKYSQGCSYLLCALLSSSATFQFVQNRKPVHEQNRSKYTSVCLKLLSDAFPKPNEKSTTMANDIEKLLLTILILTTCFTATSYFQQADSNSSKMLSWKTHLRGVKDLLLKYTELTKSSSRAYISDGLALAKSWYFSIEALAELHDPLGGTLHYSKENISQVVDIIETDSEHDHSELSRIWLQTGYFSRDKNAEYHDALLKINILTAQYPNLVQFNLFNGYSINVVRVIDELTKCLDLVREHNNVQVSGFRVAKVMSLIAQGRDSFIVPKVNKSTFEIPIESIGHPNYHKLDRISFPASCYARETLSDGRFVCYSWFDWSEQLHIDSLGLKVYITEGILKLPKTHPIVKELKMRILNSLFFIKTKRDAKDAYKNDIYLESANYYVSKNLFDERAVMAQSSFRQCLKVFLNDDDFEKLILYFKALVKLGNGGALIALEMVQKLKLRYGSRAERNVGGGDANGDIEPVESDDEDQADMAFIPYA